jgi:hypothetical protein
MPTKRNDAVFNATEINEQAALMMQQRLSLPLPPVHDYRLGGEIQPRPGTINWSRITNGRLA